MVDTRNGRFELDTWYENSSVEANVWFRQCCKPAIGADSSRWSIRGNVVLNSSPADDPTHQPQKEYLHDYQSIYLRVCDMSAPNPEPGLLPGVTDFLQGLRSEIMALGGRVPICRRRYMDLLAGVEMV